MEKEEERDERLLSNGMSGQDFFYFPYFARFDQGLVQSLLQTIDIVLGLVVPLLGLLLLQLQFAQRTLTAFQLFANLLHVGDGLVALGVQPRNAALTPLVLLLSTTTTTTTCISK
jgi:hypothetical protein